MIKRIASLVLALVCLIALAAPSMAEVYTAPAGLYSIDLPDDAGFTAGQEDGIDTFRISDLSFFQIISQPLDGDLTMDFLAENTALMDSVMGAQFAESLGISVDDITFNGVLPFGDNLFYCLSIDLYGIITIDSCTTMVGGNEFVFSFMNIDPAVIGAVLTSFRAL